MLDNLDVIDWEGFGALDVRQALLDLASQNAHARQSAYVKLESRLIPWFAWDTSNGNASEFKYALRDDIPILAIPFLIELLSTENVLGKPYIFELLHYSACYVSASRVFVHNDDPENAIFIKRARLIHDAVLRGVPVYESFLSLPYGLKDSEDMQIKSSAKDLLRILRSDNPDKIGFA